MRYCTIASSLLAICWGFAAVGAFSPAPARGIMGRSSIVVVPSIATTSTTTTAKTTLNLMGTKEKKETSVDETTEKFGLEVGLAQAAKEGNSESAKSLLAKYGAAYLMTSIPLALVSFAICYALVDQGVDVAALLSKVGIQSTDTYDKAGTFAIAYAAHKAASPIRFPPTVILTPVVAKWIGKEPQPDAEEK